MKTIKKFFGRKPSKSNNPKTVDKKTEPRLKPTENESFKALKLIEPLCRAVSDEGYSNPTPIQKKAIPILLKGRDLLGCAQTGTGKTAAFSLPILQKLMENYKSGQRHRVRALVVTPTRELALQIKESFETYGSHLPMKCAVVFGGVSIRPQISSLRQGVDILVATPGRLLDIHSQGYLKLNELSVFVLDEADRMLDMGFLKDVKRIIALLPKKRQNLLFSATMPKDISDLAMSLLTDPLKVEVAPVDPEHELINQLVYYVERSDKRELLLHILKQKEVKKVLIFTRTKVNANRVAKFLCKHKIRADAIHGNKSQGARQRALDGFKRPNGIQVLVASDLAARGIDVEAITHVINYNLPEVAETYIHRIGRTGRAHAKGCAIALCEEEERAYLGDIEKLTRKKIPVIKDHPFPPSFEQVPQGPRPKRGPGGKQSRGSSGRPRRPSKPNSRTRPSKPIKTGKSKTTKGPASKPKPKPKPRTRKR